MANIKEISKEHLERIGKRMRLIRNELGYSSTEFTDKLHLAGAVMTRFENGDGIQIFNFLHILSWLNEEGYNLKWFLLYDNESEFKKNEDTLALYTDMLPNHTFSNKQVTEKTESIIALAQEIMNITNN